jgi:hypothetical protein
MCTGPMKVDRWKCTCNSAQSSTFDIYIDITNLKNYKSLDCDQVLPELIQVRCTRSINSIILFGVRRNCLISGRSLLYQRTSLLSSSYKTLFNVLLSSLRPYVEEIIRWKECGFRLNMPTTDQIHCLLQILEQN